MSAICIDFELQRLIRTYLHEKLGYTENSQIELHIGPTQDTKGLFLKGKHAGPSLEDLHLDFPGGVVSDWNKKAFLLLRRGFCDDFLGEMTGVPPCDDKYYHDLIVDQFERLRVIWKRANPRLVVQGGVEIEETAEMVEVRMNLEKQIEGKIKRHTTRRASVSLIQCDVRVTTLIIPGSDIPVG